MEKDTKYCIVYVTCRDRDEAEKIAESLLFRRLIGCANIFPINSMFWWKGEIDRQEEFVLIAKTTRTKYGMVEKAIKEMHSYEVPCIICLEISNGNRQYLKWVSEETRAEGQKKAGAQKKGKKKHSKSKLGNQKWIVIQERYKKDAKSDIRRIQDLQCIR